MLETPSVEAPRQGTREVSLTIGGMTCGSCAARLEGRLNALEGVHAAVNYATARALVTVPDPFPPVRLIEEVHAAGFTARVLGGETRELDDLSAEEDRRVRSLGRRLIVAGLLFMPLGDASIAFWLEPSLRFPGWQWLLVAMALPVVTWCAWPFYSAAVRSLRHGTSTMDTLVSVGVVAATAWSVYAMFVRDTSDVHVPISYVFTHQSGGAIYLDVAAGLITFLLAGRYFEARSRRRAINALGTLAARGAKQVCILDDVGVERLRPISELGVGERFVVRPGETVAADGAVVFGRSVLDCSTMTGESLPVEVTLGDQVIGGTVSTSGRLVVRAQAVGRDAQLGQMLRLVEQAQNQKARAQRLADRIAAVFVPVVLAASLLTLAGWLLAGGGPGAAFNASLSVLIIACPCALGLATPTALMVASARGAQLGIFFKGYEAIEQSDHVDTVIFDKTGTLTKGTMTVAAVATAPGVSERELVRLAAALERPSEHPIGRAIAALGEDEFDLPEVNDFAVLPGSGARGLIEGHVVTIGRVETTVMGDLPKVLSDRCAKWFADAKTVVYVCRATDAIGAIALDDAIRTSAGPAVSSLHALGLRCVLLTGDNEHVAAVVAARCGMDGFMAGVSPQDKVRAVVGLQRGGHEVAMVGDGVNDGPALAQADLGLAVGTGTDVARNSADLIIFRDDLGTVPTAVRLARQTHLTIRRNLAWAFGYNSVAIPLAACGLLNPLIAAAAMALSSGCVVWNSSRLRHFTDTDRREGR